ncbi:MAG: APC family permease [Bacteroidota bacterium]
MPTSSNKTTLTRKLGLMGLAATGICSMPGASVYVVPFMIQRNVPGIGPYVLYAFLFAAVPALLAAYAYAILSSTMPRAGGSYVFASRGLHPYLGFVASFSQWFGLSIAIGVISYVTVPFLRDTATSMEWSGLAESLDSPAIRLGIALGLLWLFVGINIRGLRSYQLSLIPMMILMFALGALVIFAALHFTQEDFAHELLEHEGRKIPTTQANFDFSTFLTAAALLFSSFIGFDSIAQAGGEAKNPSRNLPRAIAIAILGVGLYYFLFTAVIYRAVPWQFVAEEAMQKDISAPGLLSYLLPSRWAVLIIGGAAIALINDLPAMLLSVSRLMFAWAKDGIFPKAISSIHSRFETPYYALILSGIMASVGILGSHFAGDFFLGVDIMVTSMLVNFILMCATVLFLAKRNPEIAEGMIQRISPKLQKGIAMAGILLLALFLFVHIRKDLNAELDAWYFHSSPVWLIVMSIASLIYVSQIQRMKKSGENIREKFLNLPEE